MKLVLLCSLLLVFSCSDDSFNKVETLENFRILGVVASAPEVAPGGTSNLQLYVSDVNGGGRTLSGTVEACIDPGISVGAAVSCDHDPSKVSGTYTIDTISDADLGAANNFTGLATQVFTATVPATILTGRSAREENNGVAYLVVFRFAVDGASQVAFKRVLASTRAVKNTNPTVSQVTVNGVPLTAKPQKDDKLTLSAGATETYDFISNEGNLETRAETLEVAWYVSSGELTRPKTEVGEDTVYKDDQPVGNFVLSALLRDDRGGLAVERVVLP